MQRTLFGLVIAAATLSAADPREVLFRSTPQGDLKAHVFLPDAWKPADRRPAIVFFFGGGFTNGTPQQFFTKAAYLASRGMVAISAEYRIKSKHNTMPDASVEDCRAAILWLRTNASQWGVDPQRIVAGGGSAGGTCAAATAYAPDSAARPNALVLYNPSMESRGLADRWPNEPEPKRRQIENTVSPVRHVRKGGVPSIQFFGTADALLEGGRKFLALANTAGNRAELWLAPGQQHGFFNDRGDRQWHFATLAATDRFLASLGYLQGAPSIQPPPAAKLLRSDTH